MREMPRGGLPFGALEAFVHTMGIPIATITKVLGVAKTSGCSTQSNPTGCIVSLGWPTGRFRPLGLMRKLSSGWSGLTVLLGGTGL